MTSIPNSTYHEFSPIVAVGDVIYYAANSYGTSDSNLFYKYDTLTDTHIQLASPPINLRRSLAFAQGNFIYLLGRRK